MCDLVICSNSGQDYDGPPFFVPTAAILVQVADFPCQRSN